MLTSGGVCEITKSDISHLHWYQTELKELKQINLLEIPSTSLMSIDEAAAACDFIARYNQAKVIEQLAIVEFEKEQENIKKWFYNAAKKNLPKLIDDLVSLNDSAFSIVHNEAKGKPSSFESQSVVLRQVHVKYLNIDETSYQAKDASEFSQALNYTVNQLFSSRL